MSMKITYLNKYGIQHTVTPRLSLVARTIHALKQNPVIIQKVVSC